MADAGRPGRVVALVVFGPSGSRRKPSKVTSVGTVKSAGTNSVGTLERVSNSLANFTTGGPGRHGIQEVREFDSPRLN